MYTGKLEKGKGLNVTYFPNIRIYCNSQKEKFCVKLYKIESKRAHWHYVVLDSTQTDRCSSDILLPPLDAPLCDPNI